MIHNINSYGGNFNLNSSTSSAIDEIIEAHKSQGTSTEQASASIKENLYLSSRSQK